MTSVAGLSTGLLKLPCGTQDTSVLQMLCRPQCYREGKVREIVWILECSITLWVNFPYLPSEDNRPSKSISTDNCEMCETSCDGSQMNAKSRKGINYSSTLLGKGAKRRQ